MSVIEIIRSIGALALVLGLIGVAWAAIRRYGGALTGRSDSRRLGVIEMLALDTRHRLFLVRRDRTEHLILVGPANAIVVESRITPAAEI